MGPLSSRGLIGQGYRDPSFFGGSDVNGPQQQSVNWAINAGKLDPMTFYGLSPADQATQARQAAGTQYAMAGPKSFGAPLTYNNSWLGGQAGQASSSANPLSWILPSTGPGSRTAAAMSGGNWLQPPQAPQGQQTAHPLTGKLLGLLGF